MSRLLEWLAKDCSCSLVLVKICFWSLIQQGDVERHSGEMPPGFYPPVLPWFRSENQTDTYAVCLVLIFDLQWRAQFLAGKNRVVIWLYWKALRSSSRSLQCKILAHWSHKDIKWVTDFTSKDRCILQVLVQPLEAKEQKLIWLCSPQ